MTTPANPRPAPPASPPAFDSSQAWAEASGAVGANREVLLALAGVFLVLPAFAMGMLVPGPPAQEGATVQALLATMGQYYQSAAPVLIAVALVHVIGTLAMLALFTDHARPTVGEAIKRGFACAPTVILAQIILGAAVGAMVLLPVALGGAAKAPAVAALGMLAGILLGLWAMIRVSLVAPAVVTENQRNPVKAMERSWRLTEGNTGRLLAFYALLGLAFIVVMVVAEGATKLLLTVLAGQKFADIAAMLVGTMFQAAMAVYFVAVSAAVFRQLTGSATQPVTDRLK